MQGRNRRAGLRASRQPDRPLTHGDAYLSGFTQLVKLTSRWRAGELDASLFAALYFLCWQIARHGSRWAARRSRHDPKPHFGQFLADAGSLESGALRRRCFDTLQRYAFLGVRPEAPSALRHWLEGEWRLTLCTDVPSPRAVLAMQGRGTRPVTVVTEFPAMLEPVHDKPDAFCFLIHDLEHAHRFFEDPVSHRDQCRLAQALLVDLQAGHFDRYLDDPIFQAKFEYLIADMNTHVAHALHYLRAILVEFHLRQAGSGPAAPLSGEAARDVATRIGILGQIVGLRAELFGCGPQGASAIAGCGMVNSLDGF